MPCLRTTLVLRVTFSLRRANCLHMSSIDHDSHSLQQSLRHSIASKFRGEPRLVLESHRCAAHCIRNHRTKTERVEHALDESLTPLVRLSRSYHRCLISNRSESCAYFKGTRIERQLLCSCRQVVTRRCEEDLVCVSSPWRFDHYRGNLSTLVRSRGIKDRRLSPPVLTCSHRLLAAYWAPRAICQIRLANYH